MSLFDKTSPRAMAALDRHRLAMGAPTDDRPCCEFCARPPDLCLCGGVPAPARFIDGTPIPPGYIERVEQMIDIVCLIEEALPGWELEMHAQRERDRR